MLKGVAFFLVLVLLAGGMYIRFGGLPDPLPDGSETAQWLAAGPEKVSYFDVTLVDDTRPTSANGDFPGRDSRALKTRIWHPRQLDIPRPLVIYCHGFMSMRSGGSYLAELLASRGYIVAAMDFPLTHFGAPGGPVVNDVVNQPGDVSFLLDQLLGWSQDAGNQFYRAIDERRIGVLGFSLGGLTATLAAFHPTVADSRIGAAVSIAGPSEGLGEDFFSHRRLPLMMVASPMDAMIAYDRNARSIPERVPGALLISVAGASHTGFTALSRYLRWLDNPDWLGCSQLRNVLADQPNAQWWHDLESLSEGLASVPDGLCDQQSFPSAMNPVRQQWLTAAAVLAFFESEFSLSMARRRAAQNFLRQQFPAENAEISVRS